MQITPEKKRLSELLPIDSSITYEIPVYQRSYSWKPTQIEQLFNDVVEEGPGYYLGNILVTGEESSPQIIDGQQRLTTLSLFLLAVAQLLKGYIQNPSVGEKVVEKRGDIRRRLMLDDDSNCARIRLLERDRTVYANLIDSVFCNEEEKSRNRLIAKRYRFIISLLNDTYDGPNELISFYDKLLAVEILRISVPEVGDAFSVFSSLNSKGLPLTRIDLLKGEFIGIATDNGHKPEKVISQWEELVNIFDASDMDASNRLVTQFLLNSYDAFEGESSSITKSKALSEYRKQIKDYYHDGVDFLALLINRARIFARIVGITDPPTRHADIDARFTALQRLESTQALPLLIYLMSNLETLQIQSYMMRILDALISFFVRRNITLTPKSSNIRSRILLTVRTIRRDGLVGEDAYREIICALSDMSASDEQFYAALNQPIYDKNKNVTRYVLIDIERRMGGAPLFNKQYPDTLDEYQRVGRSAKPQPRWTIEHILPEGNLPQEWCEMISPEDIGAAENLQAEYVHMLGNLTLTPYNPELAQRPFFNDDDPDNSKRDYRDKKTKKLVGLRSGLFLNRSIASDGDEDSIQYKNEWTIDDISRRNKILSKYVVELYPIPGRA